VRHPKVPSDDIKRVAGLLRGGDRPVCGKPCGVGFALTGKGRCNRLVCPGAKPVQHGPYLIVRDPRCFLDLRQEVRKELRQVYEPGRVRELPYLLDGVFELGHIGAPRPSSGTEQGWEGGVSGQDGP